MIADEEQPRQKAKRTIEYLSFVIYHLVIIWWSWSKRSIESIQLVKHFLLTSCFLLLFWPFRRFWGFGGSRPTLDHPYVPETHQNFIDFCQTTNLWICCNPKSFDLAGSSMPRNWRNLVFKLSLPILSPALKACTPRPSHTHHDHRFFFLIPIRFSVISVWSKCDHLAKVGQLKSPSLRLVNHSKGGGFIIHHLFQSFHDRICII